MTCACDQRIWPPTLEIAAGLDDLPRQLVTFADLRAEMLARARFQPALGDWRGRSRDDYGVMFLELWSYVGELLAIYDKAIADESYVRTAKLRPSLRRLVASLGYVPRPAVAASAQIALLADGTRPVAVPVGAAFRSGAFGGEKPQVFELTTPATIHPALNQWPLATPAQATLVGSVDELLLDPATIRLATDDVILVELTATQVHLRKVKKLERVIDGAGRRVGRVTLDAPVDAGAGVAVSGVRVRRASRKAALKLPSGVGGDIASFLKFWTAYVFILDGQHADFRTGERFLVEHDGEQRWATASFRQDFQLTLVDGATAPTTTVTLKDADGNTTGTVNVPGQTVRSSYTVIITGDPLDDISRKASPASPDWGSVTDPATFTVYYGLRDAGRVLGPAKRTLSPGDPLVAIGTRAPVHTAPTTTSILLLDVEDGAAAVPGSIALETGAITPDGGTTWSPLAAPVTGYGNTITVVRGETVASEILGDGDGSRSHQAFTLKKKPLTYVPAPAAESGVASTLRVWVDGVEWTEVPTLFGHAGNAQVYVVRQDDSGASTITFGDGIRGARLPTGSGNVVARYRFGAGAAAPPADSITQLAKPVVGVKSAVGPLPAGGGADAEPASSLATLAPRSALLLGRAISIEDMEVAALLAPGVVTARADWAWDGTRQRPVVKVWFVGGPGVGSIVKARLFAITEPSTPIDVAPATAIKPALAIDLEIDPRRIAADVIAAVEQALAGEDGWLTPARLGIARPIFRSALVERILRVAGVTGLRGLTWNGAAFTGYGKSPGTGAYFDFATTLVVKGS
ncbi:MAG: hypothetical protein HOV81_00935 [Kofleriaceae bacterium]|nr:hypothetical protein [Kofleriaceae bacterium]